MITAAGGPGLLLPPSLVVIVYAVTAGVSVDALFLATAVPALLLVAALSAYTIAVTGRGRGAGQGGGSPPGHGPGGGMAPVRRPFSGRRLVRAVWLTGWELPLPLAVVGGIYLGLITVSEAATLTAAYVLVVEVLIRREIRLPGGLAAVIRDTGALVGALLLVVGAAWR